MLPALRSPLGAPGVFTLPRQRPSSPQPQRMDVCAFVGVAPRGPAREPEDGHGQVRGHRLVSDPAVPLRRSLAVPVHGFDEYRRHFGGFEGPGALPHAVAAFFEQGGRQAWVVRIVHAEAATTLATGRATGGLAAGQPFMTETAFLARNPGEWGNRLRVEVGLSATPLAFTQADGEIRVDARSPLLPGSLLRFTDAGGVASLAFCEAVSGPVYQPPLPGRPLPRRPASHRVLILGSAPPAAVARMELVEAWLTVDDGDGRAERFEHLALDPAHPRGIASVLCDESSLLWPSPAWADQPLWPADPRVQLLRGRIDGFAGAPADDAAYAAISAEDFFDPAWSPAEEVPGQGIACLAGLRGITHLAVPDLYVPAQWVKESAPGAPPGGGAGAEFAACVEPVPATPATDNVPPLALTGLILDPRKADERAAIAELQRRVVGFCEDTQDLIALLDVPPGLSRANIEDWRAQFDSSWAAAYHPWLHPARRTAGEPLRPRPPSAVAAGIIALRELERGIHHGPANEIAGQIVGLAEAQPDGRADALHLNGINCFVREQRGVRLIAARTLSRERAWRQLSVRRLVLMLRRTLLQETQWAVFEPNGPALRDNLRHAIEGLLRDLFRAGAFAGRSEAESFFVRVDGEPRHLDRGELLAEIGVAPAEPLEFILLRLQHDGDGTLSLEE
ncbi:MAG: phage tail sheath C-terminal domain-containing protein [Pseudomonadota bacterium]